VVLLPAGDGVGHTLRGARRRSPVAGPRLRLPARLLHRCARLSRKSRLLLNNTSLYTIFLSAFLFVSTVFLSPVCPLHGSPVLSGLSAQHTALTVHAGAKPALLAHWVAHDTAVVALTQAGRRVFSLAADGAVRGWAAGVPSAADDDCRCRQLTSQNCVFRALEAGMECPGPPTTAAGAES